MHKFAVPRPISEVDNLEEFDCADESLNVWLRTRALTNQSLGASATMVSTSADGHLAGFYAISTFSVIRSTAPGRLRRGMPDPVPAVLIGKLAVDVKYRGIGLGASLLQHALLKSLQVSEAVGVRAVVVQAKDESAASFYKKFGFRAFEGRSLDLYLLISDLREALQEKSDSSTYKS